MLEPSRTKTKERRNVLLSYRALALVGFVAVLILFSVREPRTAPPLTVHFAGYTIGISDGMAAILTLRNRSQHKVRYEIYAVQQLKLDRNGLLQKKPQPVSVNLGWGELLPGSTTNRLVAVWRHDSAVRAPVHFYFAPTLAERTMGRLRNAIRERSVQPIIERQYGHEVPMTLENFAFSEELPRLPKRNLSVSQPAQE